MVNPKDSVEWVAQAKAAPDFAWNIVKMLSSRLDRLHEKNEQLRNDNIDLKRKITTEAHQREVDELHRQMTAFIRITKAERAGVREDALFLWSGDGRVMALDPDKLGALNLFAQIFQIPQGVALHLTACSIEEEILFLTNTGRGLTFTVRELALNLGQVWRKIPDASLGRDEFVCVALPVARFPLSEALVTASRNGHARSNARWNVSRFFQNAQFGTGVRSGEDHQVGAALTMTEDAGVILFTEGGRFVRFPERDASPSLSLGIKLDPGDHVLTVLADDADEVLMVSSDGKAARRTVESFALGGMGTKPKAAARTGDLIGVDAVTPGDVAVFFLDDGRFVTCPAADFPLMDRAGSLQDVPGAEGCKVLACAAFYPGEAES